MFQWNVSPLADRRAGDMRGDSEARLRALFEALPDFVAVVDAEGEIRFLNRGGDRSVAEVVGRRIDEFVPAEHQPSLRDALDGVLATGETAQLDVPAYRADGTLGWYSCRLRPAPGDGTAGEALIVATDITDRKTAEQELKTANAELEERVRQRTAELSRACEAQRASEVRLQKLIEQSPVSTQTVSPDGRILQVNAAWERLWGVTLDDIPDVNLLEDPQLEDVGIADLLRRALAGETISTPPVPYRPDRGPYRGQERWAGGIIYPVKDEAGRVEELVILHDDITERKLAQDALAESENRLRLITDSLPVLIAYIDAQQRYRFNNAPYQEWFGLASADLTGRTVREVLGESYGQFRESIEAVLSGRPMSAERQMRLRDGRLRWVQVDWVPDVDDRGTVHGYCLLAIDVTERKQREELLRRAERLAAVGTLAAGIAHEINNPLGALLTSANVALACCRQPGREERLRECLRLIQSEGQRIGRIVKGVQQFAKEGALAREPHSLRDVIARATERLTDFAVARQIGLDVRLPAELPEIRLSTVEMEQVFINLLTNAIQASAAGAVVGVRAEVRPDEVAVAVQDHGRGIPADEIDRIFDPFFTTRAGEGGIGLGLSIVHGIIAHHGGRIDVESEVGRGTTVTFRLPLGSDERL